MKLSIAPYRLKLRRGVRESTTERPGFLLRLQTAGSPPGYSSLQPWPELGDAELEEYLQATRRVAARLGSRPARVNESSHLQQCAAEIVSDWPLLASAIKRAEWDQMARVEHQALLPREGVATHVMLDGWVDLADSRGLLAAASELAEADIGICKLKIGTDPKTELAAIDRLCTEFGLRVRLDAGAQLSVQEMERYLERLSEHARASIDLVEDPCPWSLDSWARMVDSGYSIAIDREWVALRRQRRESLGLPESDRLDRLLEQMTWVIKPAFEFAWEEWRSHLQLGGQVLVTSYLDHPVGQVGAAAVAAHLRARFPLLVKSSGVATHLCYENAPYANDLQVKHGCLAWSDTVGDGAGNSAGDHGSDRVGVGFSRRLENESWLKL